MAVYYNENNPKAAKHLRALIAHGLIAPGEVDERSILDVRPNEIRGFKQCHFFAGIAGWSRALQLASWPDDRPVWTGSCPCQPFSSAGNQKGKEDSRHLWPVWESLIRECSPPTIFGEQVASAIAHGWLDDVYQGLEAENYAVGAAILPACSVGAPHRRDRLWFVANTSDGRRSKQENWEMEQQGRTKAIGASFITDTHFDAWDAWRLGDTEQGENGRYANRGGIASIMADSTSGRDREILSQSDIGTIPTSNEKGHVGNATSTRLSKRKEKTLGETQGKQKFERSNCVGGEWWAIEPNVGRVANGIPSRVDKLRGLGNAIVPQVAAAFIKSSM